MKKRKPKSRVKRKKVNLLPLMPKLTETDLQNIALAMRRKGYLTDYLHFGHAAKSMAIPFLDLEEVIAALHEAAPTYPAVLDTLRKLEGPKA